MTSLSSPVLLIDEAVATLPAEDLKFVVLLRRLLLFDTRIRISILCVGPRTIHKIVFSIVHKFQGWLAIHKTVKFCANSSFVSASHRINFAQTLRRCNRIELSDLVVRSGFRGF